MGLFGKIKNILFEDDEEFDEMPVYTKEEVKETPKKIEVESTPPVVEEPIKISDNSYFTNVKRDIDLSFEERSVLADVTNEAKQPVEVQQEVREVVAKPKEEKSVFLSFDEEEFERLNSRITKNENKARREIQQRTNPVVNDIRKANNNFSPTTTNKDLRDNVDKYKLGATPKKTFTPSPIISPVYGILDKNYSKNDIVDKKGGMKREKVVKPIVKKEETITIEQAEKLEEVVTTNNVVELDIDSVRRKAYGELENIENTLTNLEIPKVKEVTTEAYVEELPKVHVQEEIIKEPEIIVVPEMDIVPEVSIEDELEQAYQIKEEQNETIELDEVVETVIEPKVQEVVKENTTKSNPKILDELEKTSTLQILDDIEKELNSIKPITKDISVIDEVLEESYSKNDDTLEKDLFNLIDSMYVEGEEEEDD